MDSRSEGYAWLPDLSILVSHPEQHLALGARILNKKEGCAMGIARTWSFLKGAMIGAGLMYLLDEHSGGRRRALLRDKMILGRRKLRMMADKRLRDLGNRIQGAWAERRARVVERP